MSNLAAPRSRYEDRASSREDCVLMFSGGRDSTLAAVRLARQGVATALVTVTSSHLFGLDAVRRRLDELRPLLPASTRWITVRQPDALGTDTSFYERTCLPCHHAYVVVAAAIAAKRGARQLAFGYTRYQADWPEQTPLAISRMRALLADNAIRLVLPVHDLDSKEEARRELESCGLAGHASEQKCIRQIRNVALDDHRLHAQVGLWERAIRDSLSDLTAIPDAVLSDQSLSALG